MKDLISRQAVIDRINKQREHLHPDTDTRDFIGDYAYKICIEFIERMPSAQQEQRWIPCSERLPEEDGEYLVESTRGYEVLYYREEEKQFGLMVFNFAGKVEFVPKKVYEWMPLPDAY